MRALTRGLGDDDIFTDPDGALQFILTQVAAYKALGQILIQEQLQTSQMRAAALQSNQTDVAARLGQENLDVQALYKSWQTNISRLTRLGSWLKTAGVNIGLGDDNVGIPVIVWVVAFSALAIACATDMYNHQAANDALKQRIAYDLAVLQKTGVPVNMAQDPGAPPNVPATGIFAQLQPFMWAIVVVIALPVVVSIARPANSQR